MQTPTLFDQITQGIGNSAAVEQWVNAILPPAAKGRDFFRAPSTWVEPVQSLLRGSDSLRHMQLDAIHSAQKNTSALTRALAHAKGADDAAVAWRQFSQAALQNSLEYWTAYGAIVQHTEVEMLNQAQLPLDKRAGSGHHARHGKTQLDKLPKSATKTMKRTRRTATAQR
jgi:hypothetical protein